MFVAVVVVDVVAPNRLWCMGDRRQSLAVLGIHNDRCTTEYRLAVFVVGSALEWLLCLAFVLASNY